MPEGILYSPRLKTPGENGFASQLFPDISETAKDWFRPKPGMTIRNSPPTRLSKGWT